MFFRIHAIRGVDHVEIEFGAHDPNRGKKFWCGPLHRLQETGVLDRLIEDLQRFKARVPRERAPKAVQRVEEGKDGPTPQAPEEVKEGG